jgi:hypothetical protein
MGRVVNVTSRPLYLQERDLVPILQEAGWAPGPVWTGAEILAPTGIRSPDRLACSESLYRRSYPNSYVSIWNKTKVVLAHGVKTYGGVEVLFHLFLT